jgi:hypothetical protein
MECALEEEDDEQTEKEMCIYTVSEEDVAEKSV